MHADFWHERWREGQIGFHRPDFHPALLQYWPGLDVAPGARVLVPLCGRSLDMAWLAARGHQVVGVELSPIAIAEFFGHEGLVAGVARAGRLRRHAAARYELLEGDFFDTDPDTTGPIGGWYDRAALVALPPDLRRTYARHLAALIPTGVRGLLVTHDYPQEQMAGPPFSVPTAEVRDLFASDFGVVQLDRQDVLATATQFRDRGLDCFMETVFRMERL